MGNVHILENDLRETGISKEIMDTLQGHKDNGMSGRYGRGFTLDKLNEGLKVITYDGLEIS